MEKPTRGKMVTYFILLWVFGIFGFVILCAVVQARSRLPIEPTPVEFSPSADPVARLKQGLQNSLQVARINFQARHRSAALHALNAAHHAAEVGKATSDRLFQEAFQRIEETRRAVQNGHPERVPQILGQILAQWQSASPALLVPPTNLHDYDGATVINASGLRVGEVETTKRDRANLKVGCQDVLGLVKLGGIPVQIPVNRLVFGKKKRIAPITVCLPVYAQKPEEIRRVLEQ